MTVAVDRRRKAAGTSEGCGRTHTHTHTHVRYVHSPSHEHVHSAHTHTHILQAHIYISTYILALTDTLPYADTFTHEHPVFVFSSVTKCLTETN